MILKLGRVFSSLFLLSLVCNQALAIWTVHICTRSNNGNLKRHPTKSEHDTIADLFTAILVHVMSLGLALKPVLSD